MQTYELLVKERSVRPNSRDMTLVRTSIGIDQVHVLFDNAEWLDFPITVTFAQGTDVITIPLTVQEVTNSEWVAEATVTVPYEVIDMNGPIRVTFQGTDSSGRHIITAKGQPLSVEEAGDVIEGVAPGDAPTISEWQQAYADAQVLLNQAQSLVSNLEGQLDDMVAQAIASIPEYEYTLPIATDEVLGGVKIGNGIGTLADGTIFVQQQESSGSTTPVNVRKYDRIADIVDYTIQAEYEDDELSVTTISASSLPVATMQSVGMVIPDGTSITIDDDGMIHAEAAYVPVATQSSTGSVKPDGQSITVDADGTIHAVGSVSETDPTVPAWAKQPTKPTYTAQEVGALPSSTRIPTKTSDLTNDNGFLTSVPVATQGSVGMVKPDGTTITVDPDGTLHGSAQVDAATTSTAGIVRPDGTSVTVDPDGTIHAASNATSPHWEVRTDGDGNRRLAIVIPEVE